MATSPSNPPNQITNPVAAIPIYPTVGGAAVDNGNPIPVTIVGGGSQTQFVIQSYQAIASGTGYDSGDLIEEVMEFNISTSPSTYIDTFWRNATQNTAISQPTSGTYIPLGSLATTVAVSNLPSTLGSKIAADSTSVTLASDQALPLPIDASTSDLQTTGNTSLASIDGKTPVLGQAAMAASVPVAIASDQTVPVSLASVPSHDVTNAGTFAVQVTSVPTTEVTGTFWQTTQPISAASLPLPTSAATSALQTTGNTSVASIDTKTPALGQATMAASSPVVIASNQSSIPVAQTVTSRTAAMTTTTTTGNTAAGLNGVSFFNNGSIAATVAGGSLPAGQSVTFQANGTDTIGAIAYVATGTSLLIATLA
jgi:hypothetical protein